eukprot:352911-Chlamydomonas_euryale.AAC.11
MNEMFVQLHDEATGGANGGGTAPGPEDAGSSSPDNVRPSTGPRRHVWEYGHEAAASRTYPSSPTRPTSTWLAESVTQMQQAAAPCFDSQTRRPQPAGSCELAQRYTQGFLQRRFFSGIGFMSGRLQTTRWARPVAGQITILAAQQGILSGVSK